MRGASGEALLDEGVALLAGHDLVDTGDLVFVRDAEADRLLDRESDDEGDDERVDENAECGDRLDGQLTEVTADEQAGSGGEESEVQRSEQTADEVDADHVERVVEAETELQLDSECAEDTGEDTEQQRPSGGQVGAGRGDGDE